MTKSYFCGREYEMALLKTAFDKILLAQPEPQVAVLLAESGLGKTRIVQEFYNWLSTEHDATGGNGYWPDILDQEGNNLRVNPPLASCKNEVPMPFLWWGIRLSDPTGHNEVSTGSLVSALPDLTPHLEPMYWERRRRERGLSGSKKAGDAALEVAIELASTVSGLSIVKAVGKAAFELFKLGKGQLGDSSTSSLADIENRRTLNLTDSLVADFQKLLGGNAADDRVPAVILVDDAQFSDRDPGLAHAFASVLDTAFAEGWPLLVIVTHWEAEWHLQVADSQKVTVARALHERSHRMDAGWAPISIGRVTDLSSMLIKVLPGLHADQRVAVLARADGNPRYLYEILEFARLKPRLFEDRNPRKPLTPQGLIELSDGRVDLRNLIARRLADNPPAVQAAIALGSLQGNEFIRSIVEELGTLLGTSELGAGLEQAELPYAYVRDSRRPVVSFAQGIYREVAADRLPDLFEAADADEALRSVVRARLDDVARLGMLSDEERALTRRLAIIILGQTASEEDRQRTLLALTEELWRLRDLGDVWGAATVAERLSENLSEFPETEIGINALESVAQALSQVSKTNTAIIAYTHLIDLIQRTSKTEDQAWHYDDPFTGSLFPIVYGMTTTYLSYDPKLAMIYNDRGLLHHDQGHYKEALEGYARSIEISEREKKRIGSA